MEKIDVNLHELENISSEYKDAKRNLAKLPRQEKSSKDMSKLSRFQSNFRTYADNFGYKSAPVLDIEINQDTLLPFLSGLELREVNTDTKLLKTKTKIVLYSGSEHNQESS